MFGWCLVEILKMKCDQDLCLNLWYDSKKLLWQDELNPRVRCAFGNVLSFCIELTYLISHVNLWLYETVDSQHVLKVVFSSLLSEALPRFAADSTKPASLLRSSSSQNTYIINTAGALRIPKSHPIHLSRFLILRNSCLKIVYTRKVEVIWPGARKMAKLFSN